MKFITFIQETEEKGAFWAKWIVFPDQLTHKFIAHTLLVKDPELRDYRVYAAGFVKPNLSQPECYGESESLHNKPTSKQLRNSEKIMRMSGYGVVHLDE